MPIYDFSCKQCGEQFEALVLKTSKAPQCPACESDDLDQLISLFGVSSDATKAANLKVAKAKNARVRRDYEIAQREYEKEHRH